MGSQGIIRCCDRTCCEPNTVSSPVELSKKNSSLTFLEELPSQERNSIYSPQLWTGVIVLFLALVLFIQNIVIIIKKRWKKNKILPLLQQQSSGPYSTTAVGPRGFVIPKVVYNPSPPFTTTTTNIPFLGSNQRKFVQTRQSQEILGAMDILEDIDPDTKIIGNEPNDVKGTSRQTSGKQSRAETSLTSEEVQTETETSFEEDNESERITLSRNTSINENESVSENVSVSGDVTENVPQNVSNHKKDLIIPLPDPLVPPYHHHRRVSLVWDDDHQVQSLYRYTSLDRLVYPPGYVFETPTSSIRR